MPKSTKQQRVRRTDEQLIADLQAKIAAIQQRAVEREAANDPARRQVRLALKAIGRAEKAAEDLATRQAFGEARKILEACLSPKAAAATPGKGARTTGSPRRARSVDRSTLQTYVIDNPGQRGEEIAAALGTTPDEMRPFMKKLIEDGLITTEGARRGMTYSPA